MHITRFLRCALTAMLLVVLCAPAMAADSATQQPATQQLVQLDKQLLGGRAVLLVNLYPPASGKPPGHGAPKTFAAKLLFERPDRFKLVLRPGRKGERRIVGEAGKVRWLDVSSGRSGSAPATKVIDPLALLLLGAAGELPRYAALKELATGKQPQSVTATTLRPRAYGTSVTSAVAWFAKDRVVGLDFTLADGSRVFVSVLRFDANIATQPNDFRLLD